MHWRIQGGGQGKGGKGEGMGGQVEGRGKREEREGKGCGPLNVESWIRQWVNGPHIVLVLLL